MKQVGDVLKKRTLRLWRDCLLLGFQTECGDKLGRLSLSVKNKKLSLSEFNLFVHLLKHRLT